MFVLRVGPEAIRLDEPSAGTYTIVVHDYPGSVYEGDNEATVNVWVDGELAWSDTRTVSVEDSYATFATVSFPDGAVASPE